MAEDTWKLITDKMKEFKNLHDRMDKSKALVYLDKYQLKNFRNQKLDNVINVTGNKPAVFANSIISDLVQSEWQTVVEGDVSKSDQHRIEEFIEANLEQADEYLLERYGLPGLHEWLCNHVCVRGPIGAEWYAYIEKDSYNVHCLPVDMRWTAYQFGTNGLSWVAPISWRTRADLIAEFPEHESKIPGNKGSELIEVRDYWNGEMNEIWVNSQKIDERHNLSGKPPFVIVFPPSGFMLRDKDYLEHEAEDIFFMIRGLNEEVNRTLSIEQSLIFNVLRPPYEQEVENMTAEPAQAPPKTGETIKVKKGERHAPVPTGDLNRANLTARQDIYRMMDEGAPIAPRMYTQPPSGAELVAEMEALARLQNSRVVAVRVFREQLARLMIDQYITLDKGGGEFSIGKRGRKRGYSAANLKDPESYSISCQLMTKNKRQELANLAMFQAAYGLLPLRYNLTNILMAEDPDGIIRELEMEQARKAEPALGLFEMARRYAQQAAEVEDEKEADALKIQSKLLTEKAVSMVKQARQPQAQPSGNGSQPQLEQPKGNAQALMPLIGGGGGGGAPRATAPEEE